MINNKNQTTLNQEIQKTLQKRKPLKTQPGKNFPKNPKTLQKLAWNTLPTPQTTIPKTSGLYEKPTQVKLDFQLQKPPSYLITLNNKQQNKKPTYDLKLKPYSNKIPNTRQTSVSNQEYIQKTSQIINTLENKKIIKNTQPKH